MKNLSLFKSALVAGGFAVALAVSTQAAHAELPVALSSVVLKAHQDDLEAMLADLAKVQTPEVAKGYETYLAGQMDKYVGNHNRLHHGAMPAFVTARGQGKAQPDQQKVAESVDRLSDTHYPKLAQEMARVEKLNPGLKKHFDILRSLD